MGEGGTPALELVVALAEAAPDGPIMWFLGAGHVEVLITADGDELIDEIERRAAESERFRLALGGAWLTPGWVSVSTEARLANLVTIHHLAPGFDMRTSLAELRAQLEAATDGESDIL